MTFLLLMLFGAWVVQPALEEESEAAPKKADVLLFAPVAGTKLRKTYETEGRRVLDELVVRTADVTSHPENLSITVTGHKRLVVQDHYQRMDKKGHPIALFRHYEELDAGRELTTVTLEDQDRVKAVDTCKVEGRHVGFLWDVRKGMYVKRFADVPATEAMVDGEMLAGLADDMSLRVFLPQVAVAPGDEWPVEFDGFRWAVLRPGGELACESEPPEGEGERELADQVWASLAGEVSARYEGPAGEGPQPDGAVASASLGRISFRGVYTGSGEKKIAEVGMTGRRIVQEMAVEGELLWDLRENRARSLTMKTKGSVTTTDDILVREEGLEREFDRVLRFDETSELTVVFDRVQ